MHWKTSLPTLLVLPSATTALLTSRITTTFIPNCPNPLSHSPPNHPADLDLGETFSVSLNVRPGICQGIPVPLPLGYIDEVDHVFLSVEESSGSSRAGERELRGMWSERIARIANLDLGKDSDKEKQEGEVCKARLFERPGCVGEALVELSFDRDLEDSELRDGIRHAKGKDSECVTREFVRMSEMWVRFDCGLQAEQETHGVASILVNGKENVKVAEKANVAFGEVDYPVFMVYCLFEKRIIQEWTITRIE
ncbi:hypothetical protein BJY04DRAFT_220210 [Aspergillus karnatakaensis]|uniref:uncharacterized protein n=1 Tax=Aspergillus karnatakaensis TaxID=1810916 RepID=UPI003CCD68AE